MSSATRSPVALSIEATNRRLSRARYVFGDFGSGRIFAWLAEDASSRQPTELLQSGLNISAFGEGHDGELYVVHYGGSLHRMVFSPLTGPSSAPSLLSATGCVSSSDASQPASGLISYSVNAPFWSDGAEKERWMALPDGVAASIASDGDWELPSGTVLMKHFRTGTRLIETRLLMRHPDGAWGGFIYEWNAQQTDASLVQGGAQREIGLAQPWIFPSETECLECHTSVAGRSLGLENAQLNRAHTYASTNRTANQLTTLSHVGIIAPPIADPLHSLPSRIQTIPLHCSPSALELIYIRTALSVIAQVGRPQARSICDTRQH